MVIDNQNDLLEQYIFKLLQLQDQRKSEMTTEDLKNAAIELGLTDTDILALETEAARHVQRAKTYQLLKRYDDAKHELQKAYELAPLNEQNIAEMANIRVLMYDKSRKRQDLREAEYYAKRCIELAPDNKLAFDLLTKVNKIKRRRRIKRTVAFSFIALFVLLVAGVASMVLLERHIFNRPNGFEGLKYEVKIELSENPELDGITFQIPYNRIDHSTYTGSSSFGFSFKGILHSDSFEIRALRLKAVFLDSAGNKISDQYYSILDQNIILQPSDYYFINQEDAWQSLYFDDKPVKISKVVFEVEEVERYKGAKSYPEAQSIPFEWIIRKPDYLDLQLKQRKNEISAINETDKTSQQNLILEIVNSGKNSCRELSLQLQWYSASKILLDEQLYDIIAINSPELPPTAKLVFPIFIQFYGEEWGYPTPFDSLAISIKNAQ